MLLLSLFKILILLGFKKILTLLQPCCIPTKLFCMNWKEVLLYEIISATPAIVMPAAIMLSRHSSFSASSTGESLNNCVVIGQILFCFFAMIVEFILSAKNGKKSLRIMMRKRELKKKARAILAQIETGKKKFSEELRRHPGNHESILEF